uniref:TSC22 domain family protein 3 n=1 Tax=Magallana gigas TaxID=29159 RepID=A0A8W8IG81_MAGGI
MDHSISHQKESLFKYLELHSLKSNYEDSLLLNSISYLQSCCGSSTVAIDNKIEQAMDLVKSHLMYAVREEVEVLKEQIKELIEKNSQLEHENNILKAAASPETLTLLSQPRQPPPPSSSS